MGTASATMLLTKAGVTFKVTPADGVQVTITLTPAQVQALLVWLGALRLGNRPTPHHVYQMTRTGRKHLALASTFDGMVHLRAESLIIDNHGDPEVLAADWVMNAEGYTDTVTALRKWADR